MRIGRRIQYLTIPNENLDEEDLGFQVEGKQRKGRDCS
jgi:hypothetical protein